MNPIPHFSRRSLKGIAIAAAVCILGAGVAGHAAPKATSFAQSLVEQAMAAHPQLTEVGISVRSARGCHSIASTDSGDVGERCESGDIRTMRTGRPYAVKESDGYDVSLPLHDESGKLIGSAAMEFRLTAARTKADVIAQAEQIARAMETQIPSKASLLAR